MKAQYLVFIDNYLVNNDHIASYALAYPGNNRKNCSTKGAKLLKNPEVRKMINERKTERDAIVAKVRQEQIQEIAKNQVASEFELDSIVTGIARGETLLEKIFVDRNGAAKSIKVKPDASDRLAAINMLYRRNGSFIQDKRNPDDKKDDFEKKSLSELKELLNKTLSQIND